MFDNKKESAVVINEFLQWCDSQDEQCPVVCLDALELLKEQNNQIAMMKAIYGDFGRVVGQLVRCKDCKYWQDNNGGYPHIGCKWREDETPDEDDYCSCGEKYDNG